MSDYTSHVDGRESMSTLRNVKGKYQAFAESGSLEIGEFSLVSKLGNAFMKVVGARSSLMDGTREAIIKKYENTWISLSQADIMKSLSGSSEEEIITRKITEALFALNLSDIEDYLVRYPLWKEVSDLGESGDTHTY